MYRLNLNIKSKRFFLPYQLLTSLVLFLLISFVLCDVAFAQSSQSNLSVSVRVIGTCDISVTSMQSLSDQVINSHCTDTSQAFTQTESIDVFGSSNVLTETVGATDSSKGDSSNNGEKQVKLGVGAKENQQAGVQTVKTILFEG